MSTPKNAIMPSAKGKMDLLNGPLFVKILLFSLPLAMSSMLQQLFNSIDVAVVGHFVGFRALAAVGSNAPVISLLINLFMGISMGANAILSNHIGQNDAERIRRSVSTIGVLALVSGAILLVTGVCIARPILTWMDTPPEVLDMAVLYLRIYFLGMPFFMVFNFGSAILRSMGDTRRPLYILVAAGIVNTLLNLFFVLVLHMGVEGVAIATGIANAVSAVIMVVLLMREPGPFRLDVRHLRLDRRECTRMLQIGVPAGVQGMIFSISNVLVQSTINTYGASAVAGSSAAQNFEYYCYYIMTAFNGAAITFIGQNYGARRMDRVRRIFLICMGMAVLTSGLANVCITWQGDFFLSLFSPDPLVHQFGLERMQTALIWQWLACSYEISGSSLRAMGRSLMPTLYTIFGTCVLRVIWVFAVCPIWPGFRILMSVYPLSWVLTGSMVLTSFLVILRREMRGSLLQS